MEQKNKKTRFNQEFKSSAVQLVESGSCLSLGLVDSFLED